MSIGFDKKKITSATCSSENKKKFRQSLTYHNIINNSEKLEGKA